MKAKANYTVEAALICPLVCLMVCAVLLFTMRLFYQIEEYTVDVVSKEETIVAPQIIRMESIVEKVHWEVE